MILRVINAFLIGILIVFLYLAWTIPSKSQELDVAMGDSIALGTGRALGARTYTWIGASSCDILRKIPRLRYRNVVVSAGINDPPGPCVGALLDAIHAERVVVILPAGINPARANVVAQAMRHHDATISYTCGGKCTRWNFHPASYANLARSVRMIWDERR